MESTEYSTIGSLLHLQNMKMQIQRLMTEKIIEWCFMIIYLYSMEILWVLSYQLMLSDANSDSLIHCIIMTVTEAGCSLRRKIIPDTKEVTGSNPVCPTSQNYDINRKLTLLEDGQSFTSPKQNKKTSTFTCQVRVMASVMNKQPDRPEESGTTPLSGYRRNISPSGWLLNCV
jgi:hypothetical protein